MSNVFTTPPHPQFNLGVSLVRMLVGASLGGGVMWFYGTHAETIRWSDVVALVVALICFIAALRLFGESFDRKKLAVLMEVEGESTPKEVNSARLQCMLLVALGIAVAWPVIATLQAGPPSIWAYAVIAVFVVMQIVSTLITLRKSDEFTRQRIKETGWWTYFVGQTGLLAYAGGERLGLLPHATAWDLLTLFLGVSIVVGIVYPLIRVKSR